MKKSNRILIKTGFLLFLMSVVLLFPIKAKAATYQQVPTMAYLKVESGQAYLSYANSAPQLFYEPMNGETVRLTQKICTGAWTKKLSMSAASQQRESRLPISSTSNRCCSASCKISFTAGRMSRGTGSFVSEMRSFCTPHCNLRAARWQARRCLPMLARFFGSDW